MLFRSAFFKAKIKGRGSAVGDYDNDGRMDVLITCLGDRVILLRNRDASGNNWLCLDLEGTRSNRDGFGAKITLKAGEQTFFAEGRCPVGFLAQGDRRVHFGLGKHDSVTRIEIRWPSGQVQLLDKVAVNRIVKVREPANGG